MTSPGLLTQRLVEFVLDNYDLIRRAVSSLSGADRAQAERVLADGILDILIEAVHEGQTETPLLPLAAAVAAATQEIWNSILASVTKDLDAPGGDDANTAESGCAAIADRDAAANDARRIVFIARSETDFERYVRQHPTGTPGET